MTGITQLGPFGLPAPFNDYDYTITELLPASGNWTALGPFGVPAPFNDYSYALVGTRTVSVEMSAVLAGEFTPFNDWRIQAISPAPVTGALGYVGKSETATLVGVRATAAAGEARGQIPADFRIRARQYITVYVTGWQSVTAQAGPEET